MPRAHRSVEETRTLVAEAIVDGETGWLTARPDAGALADGHAARLAEAAQKFGAQRGAVAQQFLAGFRVAEAVAGVEREVALVGGQARRRVESLRLSPAHRRHGRGLRLLGESNGARPAPPSVSTPSGSYIRPVAL